MTPRRFQELLRRGVYVVGRSGRSERPDATHRWALAGEWAHFERGQTLDDPNAGCQRVQELRKQPGRARSHKPWSVEEGALRRRVDMGVDLESLALVHGRSQIAIQARIVRLYESTQPWVLEHYDRPT